MKKTPLCSMYQKCKIDVYIQMHIQKKDYFD